MAAGLRRSVIGPMCTSDLKLQVFIVPLDLPSRLNFRALVHKHSLCLNPAFEFNHKTHGPSVLHHEFHR